MQAAIQFFFYRKEIHFNSLINFHSSAMEIFSFSNFIENFFKCKHDRFETNLSICDILKLIILFQLNFHNLEHQCFSSSLKLKFLAFYFPNIFSNKRSHFNRLFANISIDVRLWFEITRYQNSVKLKEIPKGGTFLRKTATNQ